jgi:D-alanyl-D-alanine carboxypeptidase/D-alanyl-D-alanine-endopeptidase (penicillin-binding protein 4)
MFRLFVFCFLLALSCSSCQTAPQKPVIIHGSDPSDYLVLSDEAIYKDKAISPQNVGFAVYDLEENLLKIENNSTHPYIPASVQKTATALFALDTLGPKYRFKTKLAYVGKIHDGVLDGDLYLQGTGDPFFTAADLMRLAQQLRDHGVRHVSGHFYYDENMLAHVSAISPYPSFGEDSYNPGVSALSLDFNESYVEKTDTRIYSIPELPALYTAEMFSKFCEFSGVELPLAKPGELPPHVRMIAEHESFDLLKLIEMNLEFSNNLMSELILLSAGQKVAGHSVSQSEAAAFLVDWLKQKIPATDWSGYVAENGSGLNPHGRVTPNQELAILRYADGKRFDGKTFLSLLPIAGWKGSLRKRMGDPHLAFSVWAKTGTMNYTSALAGYFFAHSKKKYAFVIFITDPKGSNDPKGSGEPALWTQKAREIQDRLLARWINLY